MILSQTDNVLSNYGSESRRGWGKVRDKIARDGLVMEEREREREKGKERETEIERERESE